MMRKPGAAIKTEWTFRNGADGKPVWGWYVTIEGIPDVGPFGLHAEAEKSAATYVLDQLKFAIGV